MYAIIRHVFCRGKRSIELSSNLLKRYSGKASLLLRAAEENTSWATKMSSILVPSFIEKKSAIIFSQSCILETFCIYLKPQPEKKSSCKILLTLKTPTWKKKKKLRPSLRSRCTRKVTWLAQGQERVLQGESMKLKVGSFVWIKCLAKWISQNGQLLL